ncbi:MAG TPA: M48 family metallopeptidase [Longimicrobiales bacterium]|nr:M48 family metallopeptidase [Longimicrobiales bacterium]
MRGLYEGFRRYAGVAALAATTVAAGGCAISTQQELALGQQYATEINSQLPIVEDGEINRYINLLGDEIARQGGRQLDYTFFVVNTDVINAFAVPGGYVYLNRGLIERTDNLSELAGVMAHEIAHVELRHSVEQMEKLQQAQLGLALGSILLGPPQGATAAAVNVGAGLYFANNSREAEHEADALAVPLLVNAGIHPRGLATFFEELLVERERAPNSLEQWFSTHPLTEDRIEAAEARIAALPAGSLEGLTMDSNNFRRMQQRVRSLPPPPPEFRQENRQ